MGGRVGGLQPSLSSLTVTENTPRGVVARPAIGTRPMKRFATVSEHGIWEHLRTEKLENGVAVVRLHRPQALNALNTPLMSELVNALKKMDSDPQIKSIVLTGSERAFAAGADIKEMKDKDYSQVYKESMLTAWNAVTEIRKPIIAGVNGFCLGGGCELAMMCDIIVAGENAKFGQPEINLGIMPGNGGTQRLPLAVGKSKAMEMVLTGEFITAQNALLHGLASKVVKTSETVN